MLLKENGVGRSRLRRYGMFAFAVLLIVTGAPVALLGLKLLRLQGSPYYLIIGLVWLVAGGLALWRRAAGLYLYAASFVATVIWALWESGLQKNDPQSATFDSMPECISFAAAKIEETGLQKFAA